MTGCLKRLRTPWLLAMVLLTPLPVHAFALVPPDRTLPQAQMVEETKAIIDEAAFYVRHSRGSHAKATIHVEGTVGTPDFYISKDWGDMLVMAIAYRTTKDRHTLDVLQQYFAEWTKSYNLAQAPILEDAGCLTTYPVPRPGERCVDPIDDSGLVYVMAAHDLVQQDLPAPVNAAVLRLARNIVRSYLHDIDLREASTDRGVSDNRRSNWQAFRIELVTLAAYLVQDKDAIAKAREAFCLFLERNMVYPQLVVDTAGNKHVETVNDGSVYDFSRRDALHYAVADLEPLLISVAAARAHGEDWYGYVSPQGASLKRALDWLVPYATGSNTHEEFRNTSVFFDRQRGKTGWSGYSGQWQPQQARLLFRIAMTLDPRLRTASLQQLVTTPADGPAYDPKMTPDPGGPALAYLFAPD